jgi:hypothetical protein
MQIAGYECTIDGNGGREARKRVASGEVWAWATPSNIYASSAIPRVVALWLLGIPLTDSETEPLDREPVAGG